MARPAHLPVWKFILQRTLTFVFLSHLKMKVSSQWFPQCPPHLLKPLNPVFVQPSLPVPLV